MRIPVRKLYRIDAPHMCAGLDVEDFKITNAAPIIYWMVGKTIKEVEEYCQRKGWVITKIYESR